MDRLNEDLRSFAAARNWICLDCAAALSSIAPTEQTSDGLHLSPQAAGVLARALRETVRALVEKCQADASP
jgi:lysophospholipase L1-like esterase